MGHSTTVIPGQSPPAAMKMARTRAAQVSLAWHSPTLFSGVYGATQYHIRRGHRHGAALGGESTPSLVLGADGCLFREPFAPLVHLAPPLPQVLVEDASV
jgi:hypothetical protein